MADTRQYELQLIEALRVIARNITAGEAASSSSRISSVSGAASSSGVITAINGVSSKLDSVRSLLDTLSGLFAYDDTDDAFHVNADIKADDFINTIGSCITLLEAWRSLTNNSSLVASDITTTLKVASDHVPVASASAIGGVKVDGSTITISNGVISAAPQQTEEIYWCTYGTTTATQVADAITAGKVCAVRRNGHDYYLVTDETTIYLFVSLDGTMNRAISLLKTNSTWGSTNYNFELASRKVTSLSASSDNVDYPGAKCVYDELAPRPKYVLCADEAAYNAITNKDSATLYLIPVS